MSTVWEKQRKNVVGRIVRVYGSPNRKMEKQLKWDGKYKGKRKKVKEKAIIKIQMHLCLDDLCLGLAPRFDRCGETIQNNKVCFINIHS